MKKIRIFCLLFLFVFASSAYAEAIYKWLDEKGVVNYTDDYGKVPSEYRQRVEVKIIEDIQKPGTFASPQTLLQEGKEIKTDIYGRDENWWREKVRPLKKRLNEATENYENQRNKFMGKTTEFSGRFGSRTQYKMNVRELNRINAEMNKYESQVVEAKEMLEKLSKEAEESKANPDWLK